MKHPVSLYNKIFNPTINVRNEWMEAKKNKTIAYIWCKNVIDFKILNLIWAVWCMLSNLSNKPEKMVMIMVISPSTTYLHSGKSTCIKYSLTLMCMGGYYSSFFCEGGEGNRENRWYSKSRRGKCPLAPLQCRPCVKNGQSGLICVMLPIGFREQSTLDSIAAI